MRLLETTLPSKTALWRSLPDLEVEFTDEGDWSITVTSGGNVYLLTPEDKTCTTFAVLRITHCGGVETIYTGMTIGHLLVATR